MATFTLSNGTGTGFNMSTTGDSGFAFVTADPNVTTTYLGNIDSDSAAYQIGGSSFADTMVINYLEVPTGIIIQDLYYGWSNGLEPVLAITSVDMFISSTDLNSGSSAWVIRMNAEDDQFYGNDHRDIIRGGLGHDLLVGNGGNDHLMGDDGEDMLSGGFGDDTINGGADFDLAIFGGSYTNYSITQNADGSVTITDLVGGFGSDTLFNIEAFNFGAYTFGINELFPPPPPPPPPSIYNLGPAIDVREGGIIAFIITRTGGFEQETVTYSLGGTAMPGLDRDNQAIGSVTFQNGEANKIVIVQTYNDNVLEERETVTIALGSTSAGGTIGVGTSVVGILDATPLPPPPTPEQVYSGNDRIIGTSGNDSLKGYAGNDRLEGRSGNDYLSGGDGNDALSGGRGRDSFVFDTKPHKATNKDAIKDFRVVDDTMRLDNAVYTKIGKVGTLKAGAFWTNNTGKAHDKDDRIIYDKDSGVLYYDADGSGKGAGVAFATITKNLALTNKDFYVI